MKKHSQTAPDSQEPEKSQGLQNIMKWIFLLAVLTGAWFLLDWLINGK